MEKEIITILKENGIGKNTIQFTEVNSHKEIYGLYVYRNKVNVLRENRDIDFDSLPIDQQEITLNLVKSKKWEINNALQ